MKISTTQLKKLIRQSIKEQIDYKDILPGADGEFYKYASKVDDFINDTMEKAQDLYDEGQELVKADILGGHDSSVKAAERNRYIQRRVGMLHRIKGAMVNAYETLRREA